MTEGIDSSLASLAAVPISKDAPRPLVDAVPPLTWMAGFGALADLLINRILIQLGHDVWTREQLLRLGAWGGFALNLSVVSALVALAFCIGGLSVHKNGLPLSARLGVAGFGWVFVSIVAMMTLLPRAYTRPEVVLMVTGLGHALMLLLVLAGMHWRSTRAATGALMLTLVAAFSGVASMIVTQTGQRYYFEQSERLSNAFRWSGELAYLAVPLAVATALVIPWRQLRGKLMLFCAISAATLVTAGMLLWKQLTGDELPTLVYGALRLDFLPDESVVLYAIPLAIGWAVTTAAALSKDPTRRQMGAALLLLLSAGFAPRTPSTLVMTVLGIALLARVGIALARRRQAD